MNTARLVRSSGFSLGVGYGAGLAVGVVGGMALCAVSAAAIVGGFLAVKSYIHKRKEEREKEENRG